MKTETQSIAAERARYYEGAARQAREFGCVETAVRYEAAAKVNRMVAESGQGALPAWQRAAAQ